MEELSNGLLMRFERSSSKGWLLHIKQFPTPCLSLILKAITEKVQSKVTNMSLCDAW